MSLNSRLRGISLVELLIAMALGLGLSANVLQLYVVRHGVDIEQQARVRARETARLGLSHLAREVRSARRIVPDAADDCLVLEHIQVVSNAPVTTRYCIAHRNNNPENPPSLYHRRTGSPSAPALNDALFDNVHQLDLRFGITYSQDAGASISAWLAADEVPDPAVNSVQVRSVRITLWIGVGHSQALEAHTLTATPRARQLQ